MDILIRQMIARRAPPAGVRMCEGPCRTCGRPIKDMEPHEVQRDCAHWCRPCVLDYFRALVERPLTPATVADNSPVTTLVSAVESEMCHGPCGMCKNPIPNLHQKRDNRSCFHLCESCIAQVNSEGGE